MLPRKLRRIEVCAEDPEQVRVVRSQRTVYMYPVARYSIGHLARLSRNVLAAIRVSGGMRAA